MWPYVFPEMWLQPSAIRLSFPAIYRTVSMTISSYLWQEKGFVGNLGEASSHKGTVWSRLKPAEKQKSESDCFFFCSSFYLNVLWFNNRKTMWVLREECVVCCRQPLSVSRINWQREQSKQSLPELPGSMPVHENLAGILVQPCYLSPSGWEGCLCACANASMWPVMCVCSQKSQGGHGTDCTLWPHMSPLAANQSSRTAEFPLLYPSSYRRRSRRSPALLFLWGNSHLLFTETNINLQGEKQQRVLLQLSVFPSIEIAALL